MAKNITCKVAKVELNFYISGQLYWLLKQWSTRLSVVSSPFLSPRMLGPSPSIRLVSLSSFRLVCIPANTLNISNILKITLKVVQMFLYMYFKGHILHSVGWILMVGRDGNRWRNGRWKEKCRNSSPCY